MANDLTKMKILVVEDQPQAMMLITMILKELNTGQVITASDGAAALELLDQAEQAERPVDLIISDWIMPQKSGLELLQEARRRHPDIPFVMVTANADARSIDAAKKHGVNSYITKPYTLEEVEYKLKALVQQI